MLVIPLYGRKMCSDLCPNFYRAVLVFDAANQKAGKLMLKTWFKDAEIKHVGTYFYLPGESPVHSGTPCAVVDRCPSVKKYRAESLLAVVNFGMRSCKRSCTLHDGIIPSFSA